MWMEMEKSKVLIKFLLNFRQSGDVLFFLNVRRLRGYTATGVSIKEPSSYEDLVISRDFGKETECELLDDDSVFRYVKESL